MNTVNYLPSFRPYNILSEKIISHSRTRSNRHLDRGAILSRLSTIVRIRWYERYVYTRGRQEAQLVPWTFVLVPERELFFSKSRRLNTGTTKVESWSGRTAGLCYLRSAIRVLSNAAFTVAYTPARIPFSLLPNPIDETLVSFTWLVNRILASTPHCNPLYSIYRILIIIPIRSDPRFERKLRLDSKFEERSPKWMIIVDNNKFRYILRTAKNSTRARFITRAVWRNRI